MRAMPTLTAIALDRLLEPRASESIDGPAATPMPAPSSKPPHPKLSVNLRLERRNSTSDIEGKVQQPRISPALYTTPEATPLPDSPSSYSPSPYIINHKRRGPRLLKSSSDGRVSTLLNAREEEKGSQNQEENGNNTLVASADGTAVRDSIHKQVEVKNASGIRSEVGTAQTQNGTIVLEVGNNSLDDKLVVEVDSPKWDPLMSENFGDGDDFYDPQDSLSYASNTEEDNNGSVTYSSSKHAAASGEFFDAWEALSSGSGQLPSLRDLEEELREIQFGLLMEIEKRKQAEETLTNMQSQWQRIRHELSLVGLTLPAYPNLECEQSAVDPLEDLNLSEQVFIARFVADAVGRGTARAEVETEMKAQIQAKNFEIAHLMDRLRYYEAANHEMSQRNQEAVERERRLRQRRIRRQKWVWGSVAAGLSLCTAALLWSFLPTGRESGSSSVSQSPELEQGNEAKE